jgi:hypothetical protein
MQWISQPQGNEILLLAGKRMELEDSMLSEISQMQKNKFHMFYLYVEVKKKKST